MTVPGEPDVGLKVGPGMLETVNGAVFISFRFVVTVTT
jgi:hypothetical protein